MIQKIDGRPRTVLPTVYSQALSYEEVLGKVMLKLDELIDFINDEITEYIREHMSEIFINAMYDEASETITFYDDRG